MTDAELDQCRHDGALLRSIVADQVKLKKEGREWKGLCPFHNETIPSFTVYEDGHFYCYGCGAHGTVFDYVMKRDGVEFPEAAKRVAAEIGAAPSRAKPKQPANGNGSTGAIWQPIVPPPADAPLPTADQLRCDTLHEYRDANGRVLCYVRRVEAKSDKAKQFYPLTFGVLDGKTGWHTKAPDKPKPLYGLNRLAHAPDAVVLLCEGEKSADAARRLFPDMVAHDAGWAASTATVAPIWRRSPAATSSSGATPTRWAARPWRGWPSGCRTPIGSTPPVCRTATMRPIWRPTAAPIPRRGSSRASGRPSSRTTEKSNYRTRSQTTRSRRRSGTRISGRMAKSRRRVRMREPKPAKPRPRLISTPSRRAMC